MKKHISLLLLLLLIKTSNAQFCTVLPKAANQLSTLSTCSFTTTPSMYNIRVNIHYLLRTDGTGNKDDIDF